MTPRKKSSTRKRRFSNLESVQGEGTSMDLQGFNNAAIGVSEVSGHSQWSFGVHDNAIGTVISFSEFW